MNTTYVFTQFVQAATTLVEGVAGVAGLVLCWSEAGLPLCLVALPLCGGVWAKLLEQMPWASGLS